MTDELDLTTLNKNVPPFAKHLGITITSAAPDRIEGELNVTASLCTRPEILHGGAIMGFADNLGALGTVLNLPAGHFTTTVESKTNFMRPVPLGSVAHAVCTPIHRGRKTMVWRTDIMTENGKLAATVTQTQIVLEPAPT